MEKGFFHPDRGYWQTTSEPPQHILDGYPEGTVEVPVKPSANHELRDGKWVEVAPVPAEQLDLAKSEARAYLAETDWMVVRSVEEKQPLDPEVRAKRAEARKIASS
jgi:hypothetical protein